MFCTDKQEGLIWRIALDICIKHMRILRGTNWLPATDGWFMSSSPLQAVYAIKKYLFFFCENEGKSHQIK